MMCLADLIYHANANYDKPYNLPLAFSLAVSVVLFLEIFGLKKKTREQKE